MQLSNDCTTADEITKLSTDQQQKETKMPTGCFCDDVPTEEEIKVMLLEALPDSNTIERAEKLMKAFDSVFPKVEEKIHEREFG